MHANCQDCDVNTVVWSKHNADIRVLLLIYLILNSLMSFYTMRVEGSSGAETFLAKIAGDCEPGHMLGFNVVDDAAHRALLSTHLALSASSLRLARSRVLAEHHQRFHILIDLFKGKPWCRIRWSIGSV